MPTAVTQQAVHFVKPFKPAAASAETWSRQSIEDLFNLPFNDLLYKAQQIHREHFNPNEVQLSTLLSIKTGGCPEDCGYCPQSVHYDTGVEASKMLDVDAVKAAAVEAEAAGRGGLSQKELDELVASSDTGGRAATGAVGTFLMLVALFWSLFQIWIASPEHQAVWPGIENTLIDKSFHVSLFDEV